MKRAQPILVYLAFVCVSQVTLISCKKDNPAPSNHTSVTWPGKEISSFKIVTPTSTGVIDTVNQTITIGVPSGTDITKLTTEIALASGLSISPASGQTEDFTNSISYTVTQPNKTTTVWTVTVKVASNTVTVDQDITQSITWTADKVYHITGSLNVSNNAIITIQPGTVIQFDANASLNIGASNNATFIAIGTANMPIIFTSSAVSPAAGAWDGLYFYNNTLNNSALKYCKIMYAGNSNTTGAINLEGCDLAIDYTTISFSNGYGIVAYYANNKGGFVSFTNNSITSTSNYGLSIEAQKLSTIGTGNTFTGSNGIFITGSYNNNSSQTWINADVPYIVDHELDIDGNLTISPGTTFEFTSGGSIEIGYYASTTFVADGGSSTTPITFTSNAVSPTAGSWKYINFYDLTLSNSIMNYCTINYAGSDSNFGAVNLSSSSSISITFTNNTISNSASYGIKTIGDDAGFQAFNNNTINTCSDHVVVTNTKHLPDLGTGNTLTAAAGKGIEFSGSHIYTTPVTWKKQTADFYVSNGENDIDGSLTLEAGTKFLFESDSYFWFGYYASTVVTAIGTSSDMITFTTAATSPAPGGWKGLYFDANYTQTNTQLDYCKFEYSGLSGVPAIYTGASINVNNCSIQNYSSANAAEYLTGIALPPGTGNDFTWVAK